MNLLSYSRGVFLKDMRVQRNLLLIMLALGLAITETFPSLPNAGFLEPTFALLFVGTEFFLTVLVIQSDPAGREFRFLLTRPVPGAAIGVAKALFLTVFIVGPFWIAQEFELARVGVALSVSDHVLL